MERLRRSFRESFRRRKDSVPDSSKPHLWQSDEASVRAGTCQFHVKYLGCVEVYESRGMQVCEEALKVLRNSRRRPIKGILHVSGDGLRVVEDETKGLLVDQTIEKVSFCAPDRSSERGFSYICRDGTTRRWMCHGFLAAKDSGERLSHAVGCAFAVCLERKQKREKESVAVNYDPASSAFTRTGSFRTTPLTERLQDPQECKPAAVEPPPVKPVVNPYAIERPHAAPHLLQRQGSFRGLSQLNQSSPFKRQLSLRIGDLPSTLERQQNSLNAEAPTYKPNLNGQPGPESPQPPPRSNRLRIQSTPCPNNNMAPIPESSPMVERSDAVSAMCQQLSQGLSLLSSTDDPFLNNHNNQEEELERNVPFSSMPSSSSNTPYQQQQQQSRGEQWLNSLAASVTTVHGAPPFSLPPRRSGPLHPPARSQSLGSSPEHLPATQAKSPVLYNPQGGQQNSLPSFAGSSPFQSLSNASNPPAIPSRSSAPYSTNTSSDPFDADWASLATRNPGNTNTNPFTQSSVVKTFEVHM